MPQTKERNLELAKRNINKREKRPAHAIPFELTEIMKRFENNIASIQSQFTLMQQLKTENNPHYKDILRSQVVFLDSAFDFFMHEITKYGMGQIFQGNWEKTEKYNNFTLCLGDISDVLQHTECEGWFIDVVNSTFANDTFMDASTVISQLNLIGLHWQSIAKAAFYETGSNIPTSEKFKNALNSLFSRRNKIVHQADCLHETGEKIDIEPSHVENYINNIEQIVHAVYDAIKEKDT